MTSLNAFSESLNEESTTGRFIMDKRVASYGGSITSKENPKSRICPGAKTSLYKQMIMIAIILRDYSVELTDSNEISCDIDANKHSLCTRLDVGNVVLTKLIYSIYDDEKVMSPGVSLAQSALEIPSKENPTISKESKSSEHQYTYRANLNLFFNQAKRAWPGFDSLNTQKFLSTTLTMGAVFALHNLTT